MSHNQNINECLNLENLDEEWKKIENFPDYQISNFGRVKSLKFGKEKIRKFYKDKDNYLIIRLYNNGKSKYKKSHQLVYETFYNDKLKSNECVHHKDENKENNYYENLEKITKYNHNSFHKKNITNETRNKLRESRKQYVGENHPRHKLTEQQVIQINMLFKLNFKNCEIYKLYDIDKTIISKIRMKKIWSYVKV
jgi:hypothetical protein